jgi:hypothetical protein
METIIYENAQTQNACLRAKCNCSTGHKHSYTRLVSIHFLMLILVSEQCTRLMEGDARNLENQILEAIVSLSQLIFKVCCRFPPSHIFAIFYVWVHSHMRMVRLAYYSEEGMSQQVSV